MTGTRALAEARAVYLVNSRELEWEGEAASHDDAIRLAFTDAPASLRLGFAVHVKIKDVRGSSRYAYSGHFRPLMKKP